MTTNDGAFRPLIDYFLAHQCPRCKAAPGQPCQSPRKGARDCHAPRMDRGFAHYCLDVGKAPLAREPGRCYSTLPDPAITRTEQ